MPSVVARGTRNSPRACSPLTLSGPANPIGTCATPVKFSMFPFSKSGSKEKRLVCSSCDPEYQENDGQGQGQHAPFPRVVKNGLVFLGFDGAESLHPAHIMHAVHRSPPFTCRDGPN